jgi:hypothetical protein
VIRRQSLLAVTAATLAMLSLASLAGAQERGAPVFPIPYRAIVAINPLGIPFDIGAFEVEGVILPGISLAAAASYSALGDDEGDGAGDPRFASGDVKVRYYPGEVALRGFSVGLGLGVTRYSERVSVTTPAGPILERQALTAPTISVLADYNFLLGARQRFVVGTGIGAKRLLASGEDRERVDAPRAYPFLRFVLGIAF